MTTHHFQVVPHKHITTTIVTTILSLCLLLKPFKSGHPFSLQEALFNDGDKGISDHCHSEEHPSVEKDQASQLLDLSQVPEHILKFVPLDHRVEVHSRIFGGLEPS